jgi:hypothetical protein
VASNMERTATGGSGYGIHYGDPLAEPPRQPTNADSGRDAPPTRMSNKSQMSNVSYGRTQGTGFADSGGDDELVPPRRTLRRMYEDQSHYQKDEFLHGIEPAPSFWKPESTTRNTLFHKGFYRGIVTGQDAIRKEHEQDKEARSMWREQPRNQRLTGLSQHHFLREDPPAKGNGRRHFQEASNIMIRGPERCAASHSSVSIYRVRRGGSERGSRRQRSRPRQRETETRTETETGTEKDRAAFRAL